MYAARCGSHAVIRVIENWGAYEPEVSSENGRSTVVEISFEQDARNGWGDGATGRGLEIQIAALY